MNEQTLMLLLLAGGLIVFLIGVLMVLAASFRRSFLWGLLILILTPVYVLYSLLYWSEARARNGLLVSLVGLMVAAAGFYGGAWEIVRENLDLVPDARLREQVKEITGRLPTAGPGSTPLPNEAEAAKVKLPEGEHYNPLVDSGALGTDKVEPLPPKEDESVRVAPPKPVERVWQVIEFELVPQFTGRPVKIVTGEGKTREGTLASSKPDSLSLEYAVKSGMVAFEFPFEGIRSVEVYDVRGAASVARRKLRQQAAVEGQEAPGAARPPAAVPQAEGSQDVPAAAQAPAAPAADTGRMP